MDLEIIDTPLQFHLHGLQGVVTDRRYAEVGLKLMDQMWKLVKESRTANTGINYWVYLPGDRMFVGIELLPAAPAPAELEQLQFELPRYAKHLHAGPYQTLPQKWAALQAELIARGEKIGSPSLEIYGHQCEGTATEPETTILICLEPR